MNNLNKTLLTLSLLSPLNCFAQQTIDYTTTVKVNDIEINSAVPANQVEKLTGKINSKINKIYAECTGNYEYSASLNSKSIRFEIYPEDNPQIKSKNFYQSKNNFQQLGATKGRVWLTWSKGQMMNDKIIVKNILITPQYSLAQFKKDFPTSAKTGTNVLMLNTIEVKNFLKNPTEYDAGYTSFVGFKFKNGKLESLDINQGIAC